MKSTPSSQRVLIVAGAVHEGVRCLRCGYELRGMPVDDRCPECGRPVRATLASLDPRGDDRGWLLRVAHAARAAGRHTVLVVAGTVAACLAVTLQGLLLVPDAMADVLVVVAIAGALALVALSVHVATILSPRPGAPGRTPPPIPPPIAIGLLYGSLAVIVVLSVLLPGAEEMRIPEVTARLLTAVALASPVTAPVVLASAVRRIDDVLRSLDLADDSTGVSGARRARRLRVMSIVAGLSIVGTAVLDPLLGSPALPHRAVAGAVQAFAVLAVPALVIVVVDALRWLSTARTRLREHVDRDGAEDGAIGPASRSRPPHSPSGGWPRRR